MVNLTRLCNKNTKRGGLYLCGLTIFLSIILIGMAQVAIMSCSDPDYNTDPTRPTSTPTPTSTVTVTPTSLYTQTPTPSPTPEPGWRTEQSVGIGGRWLDLASNEQGELVIGYIGDLHVAYTMRDLNGTWSNEQIVPGSENNVEYDRFFVRTEIDTDSNLYFAWTEYHDACWENIFFNKWNAASESWTGDLTVVYEFECTHTPDITLTEDPRRVYVAGQMEWGVGFNWDSGDGWYTDRPFPITPPHCPLWDYAEKHEPKQPRITVAADGKLYMVIWDYFAHDGKDQLAINSFDPTTNTWGSWDVPAPENYGTYPGLPEITAGPDGSVHVVYFNWHAGHEYDEIVYMRRDPDGNWSGRDYLVPGGDTIIEEEEFRPSYPCLEVNEDNVVMVVWAVQKTDEEEIFYMSKKPNEAWTSKTRVTTSEKQHYPSTTVVGKTFYVAWSDETRASMYINEYVP